jgi:CubicO group peptidase (beta-lactamase class C family)
MKRFLLLCLAALLIFPVLSSQPIPVTAQDDGQTTYTSPDERYSVPVPSNWTVDEQDDYTVLRSPEDTIQAYFLTTDTADLRTAIDDAWAIVLPEFELEVAQEINDPQIAEDADVEEVLVLNYDGGNTRFAQGAAVRFEGVTYVQLYDGELTAIQRRSAQVNVIASGYEITAQEREDLSGVEAQPVTDEMLAEIEAFVSEAIELADIPGAAVAIVQDGEVIYINGFGVRDRETQEPVDPQTLFAIASTTKTMTTVAMASLVEDGVFDWETPVVDVLPQFAVADPELTQQITMENLVCACTGVPRRDFEFFFNGAQLTAQDIVEQLATFEIFTDFGETFQYSNQMVATGGYAAAAANGTAYDNLLDGYVDMVNERVLGPVGMENSTFDFDAAISGNVASPYITKLGEGYVPAQFSIERPFIPAAPAGGLWSNAEDMAAYVQMLLNGGTTVDGTEIAAMAQLERLWEPQAQINAQQDYGLGFILSDYFGVRVISHAGNLVGYTSEMAFVPQADLGFVMLTNARSTNNINGTAFNRLMELVYGRDQNSAERLLEDLRESQADDADTDATTEPSDERSIGEVVVETVEPYVGTWANPELGEITLELTDENQLFLDAGEFRGEIVTIRRNGEVEDYVYSEAPFEGAMVSFEDDVFAFGTGEFRYDFTRIEE